MNINSILAAEKEAVEFIKRCKVAREALDERSNAPAETGALRRQSMELTRALAELRRPHAY